MPLKFGNHGNGLNIWFFKLTCLILLEFNFLKFILNFKNYFYFYFLGHAVQLAGS